MGDKKYKSIREVSEILDLNMHIIRYWDSKFSGISTRLNNNTRRFFNNENIRLLKDLKSTLYSDGKQIYSLDLAKKIIENRNISPKHIKATTSNLEKTTSLSKDFNIDELKKISDNLKKLLNI